MISVAISALALTSVSGLLNNANIRSSRPMALNQAPEKGTKFNYDPSNYKDSNNGNVHCIFINLILMFSWGL
jgi:hypothetical protein